VDVHWAHRLKWIELASRNICFFCFNLYDNTLNLTRNHDVQNLKEYESFTSDNKVKG